MKKRLISVLLSVLMVASLLLTGCSGSPTASTPADSKTDAPEKVQIRFMDIFANDSRNEYFARKVEEFNAQSETIEVVFESVPWSEAHSKMVVLGEANSLPDAFMFHLSWMTEFADAGWICKLDEFYEGSATQANLAPVIDGIMVQGSQVDPLGCIYGIPYGLNPHFMFVRTDWLEEIGLTTADLETWEGIFKAAELMTDPEQNRYGFTFRGGSGGFDQARMYVVSKLGGRLFDENGVCMLDTPEAIAAFQDYVDLYVKGYAPPDSVNWGFNEQVQAFASGLTGIINQNFDCAADFSKMMEEGTWEMIPFPRSVDGKIYNKAETSLYAISGQTKYSAQAWEFIEFLMAPENACELASLCNMIPPVTTEGVEVSHWVERAVAALQDPTFVRMADYGYFPEVGEFTQTMGDPGLQAVCMGTKTAEELMIEFAEYLTECQQNYMESDPEAKIPDCIYVN